MKPINILFVGCLINAILFGFFFGGAVAAPFLAALSVIAAIKEAQKPAGGDA